MPSYNFLTHPTEAQIQDIIRLYEGEGWWEGGADNPETVRKILAGSHCFVVVTEGENVIGMGRAISDRASDAYIQDVTVLPEFRGAGIGTRIIRMIMDRLTADGIGWIGLIAEKNASPFYEPLGFSVMPDALPMLCKSVSLKKLKLGKDTEKNGI